MSGLLRAQFLHRSMVALLLTEAARLALPVKLLCSLCQGDHHSKSSLHKLGLALDLAMIFEDGRYGTWDDFLPLGEYWESLGGSWGGRFDLNMDGVAKDDSGHFSLAWQGRR